MQQLDLLQGQAVTTAGRIIAITGVQVTVGEVRSVDEPKGSPILANKLRRNIQEIALLAEVLHIDGELPGAGNPVRLENISVEA